MVSARGASKCRRARTGFALVDVIVATVLLGVVLTASIGLAGRAISSQATGQRIATAAMLADEQLNLVLSRGPDEYARRFATSGACDAPFEKFSYALKFDGGASLGEPTAVTVTISWREGTRERSISVDTVMASRSGASDGQTDPDRRPAQTVERIP